MIKKRLSLSLIFTGLGLNLILLLFVILFLDDQQLKYAARQMGAYLDRIHFEREAENSSLYNALWSAADWADGINVDSSKLASLNKQFSPLVSNTSQMAAISILWPGGESYLIRHEAPHFESFFARNDALDSTEIMVWPSGQEAGFIVDTLIAYPVQAETDFLQRWKQEIDTILPFPLTNIPGLSEFSGVSFTLRILDEDGKDLLVTAYRSLQRAALFSRSTRITDSSSIVLFTKNGMYFNDATPDTEGFLIPWEEARGTVLFAALSEWAGKPNDQQPRTLIFRHMGKRFYATFDVNQESANGIWTALIMPETDFGFFASTRLLYLLVLILVLITGLLLLIRRMILRRDMQGVLPGEDEPDLVTLISQGESDQLEFKSTVRLNLHTQKMGKEIELAWLKSVAGFCNTDGGIILIGVNDDGKITGLGPDRFPNDDKALLHVQNLIKQHIGLQFTKYIRYSIQEQEDEKVLMVICSPCKEPVFLFNGDKEQFIVRSGPASIELGISKALKYIQDRSG